MTIETYAVAEVASVTPDQKLAEAIDLLRSKKVGSLVATEQGRPVGILTDRDVALAVHARGLDPAQARVSAVMQAPVITAERGSGVRAAIQSLAEHGLRRLPVVDEAGKLTGVLSLDDLVLILARELFLLRSPLVAQRPTVQARHPEPAARQLGEHYRSEVVSVQPEASAADIARAMERESVGAVIVCGEAGQPLGILTDRDLATRAAPGSAATARDLMSSPLATIEPSADLEAVIQLMQHHSIRRVPVVDGGKLVGIVTLDDLLVLLGRELADLGVAIRHSIERSRRSERLESLRSRLHETIDWSLDQAASLGEKAQERLGRELESIREALRKRLS